MTQEPDAWRQLHALWERFSQEWEVRSDLVVTALGPDRSVRLRVGDHKDSPKFRGPNTPPSKNGLAVTQRNVGTMRELAAALVAACDFVDAVNPEWASRRRV